MNTHTLAHKCHTRAWTSLCGASKKEMERVREGEKRNMCESHVAVKSTWNNFRDAFTIWRHENSIWSILSPKNSFRNTAKYKCNFPRKFISFARHLIRSLTQTIERVVRKLLEHWLKTEGKSIDQCHWNNESSSYFHASNEIFAACECVIMRYVCYIITNIEARLSVANRNVSGKPHAKQGCRFLRKWSA